MTGNGNFAIVKIVSAKWNMDNHFKTKYLHKGLSYGYLAEVRNLSSNETSMFFMCEETLREMLKNSPRAERNALKHEAQAAKQAINSHHGRDEDY